MNEPNEPAAQITISLATKDKEGGVPLVTSKRLVINFSKVEDFNLNVEVIKLLRLMDKNEKLIGKKEWQVL